MRVARHVWMGLSGSFQTAATVKKEGELWVGVVTFGMKFTLLLRLFDRGPN